MKMKILYTLVALLSTVSLSAQSVTINLYDNATNTTGTLVNGDTVELIETADHYEQYFIIGITPSNPSLVKFNVKEVSGNSCFTDQVCAFLTPDPGFQGSCWSPNSTNYMTPTLNIADPASTIIKLKPQGSMTCGGCFQVRYIVIVNDVVMDSVDLKVCTTLNVNQNEEPELSMSVYPNPANNFINVSTKGTDGNSILRITDVLGKVVLEETITENKKLDVSDFKNGVYLVNVIENGVSTKSKRIVVRH
jgi:hypothetical protein